MFPKHRKGFLSGRFLSESIYWRTSNIIQSQHNLVAEWITVVTVTSLSYVYTFMYQVFCLLVLVEFSSCEGATNISLFPLLLITAGPHGRSVDRHRGSGGRYTLPHQHHVTTLQDGACCTFLEESLLSDSSQKKHTVMFDCNHTEVSQCGDALLCECVHVHAMFV